MYQTGPLNTRSAFSSRAPPFNTSHNFSHTDNSDESRSDKMPRDPLLGVIRWIKARSKGERLVLAISFAVLTLLLLYFVIEDHDTLFVLSEIVHMVGISILAHKLLKTRNSGGLSLKSQELTALFLAVRLFCSFVMEYDVHTMLDLLTLGATAGVIYCLRGPLKATYQKEIDITSHLFVLIPCLILACVAHPKTRHSIFLKILWAFCVYLEAVSVLPQLRMMQKAGSVEKFTAHYVFALGLSRFISCSHWILQILEGDKFIWKALGNGIWPVMVLLSEIVQTFILADFCYIYVKSFAQGSGVIQLPAGVV